MNVLFLSNIATPYQLDFLEEMNKNENVNVYGYFLFAKEENRDWALTMPEYVQVANYSNKSLDYSYFLKFINNKKIDKIIIGGYSLPLSIFTILISKIKKINIYFWLERPINEQIGIKKYLKELYLKVILNQAEAIFAIGKIAVKIYSKYHRSVFNLPYSMNLNNLYNIERTNNEKDEIRFLFSGQYIDRKNIINTINAFKAINNPNIELNLIGGGELQFEVSKLIKDDKRINDLGFIQPNELVNIYANNDIFLMPSRHDGWALVINEAMASSMPIISTNRVGAVVEYIKHKENGYICSTTEKDIKNGIEYYIKNSNLIKRHGEFNKTIIGDSTADVRNAVKVLVKKLSE